MHIYNPEQKKKDMHRVGHTYPIRFIKKITIDMSIFQVVT
jgi:hypothetical protein